jgi:hypothetical protein
LKGWLKRMDNPDFNAEEQKLKLDKLRIEIEEIKRKSSFLATGFEQNYVS